MVCLSRAIKSACGDEDDCVVTSEAAELAEKLDKKDIHNLPRPGQVDFIIGGPPCQVQGASDLLLTYIRTSVSNFSKAVCFCAGFLWNEQV